MTDTRTAEEVWRSAAEKWEAECKKADAEVERLTVELAALRAEIERRDSFAGCDGCSTGDCPHKSDAECIQAQAKDIAELAAAAARSTGDSDE